MHLEMDGWKMTISVWGPAHFSGELFVLKLSEDMDAQMPVGG